MKSIVSRGIWPRETPVWTWVLVGLTCALWLRERAPLEPPAIAPETVESWRMELDPARMSPRELRRLPGIGEKRSLNVARERWKHDPAAGPLGWSDVYGIGEITERRVLEWLA
ncbi:MAG: hypothetical protein O7B99_12545, partial [Planctomycetota bacterium]|nr:hypothetical protein [Planctomycetota bacterium]